MQPYHNYKDKFPFPNGKMIYVPTEETRRFGSQSNTYGSHGNEENLCYFYHLRRGGHVAAARNHFKL